jgi:glycosyltransferase involved in cell wall biosynthesis
VSLYSADPRCGLLKRTFAKSPVTVLETDAASPDAVPVAVRAAANSISFGEIGGLAGFREGRVPQGADSVVTWLAGDLITEGSAATIRHDLRTPGRRVFVPVHIRCLAEMPFVTIQPRWFRSGRSHDYWNFTIRIQSAVAYSPLALDALKINDEPWAKLAGAVMMECANAGSGVAVLVDLWEHRDRLPAMLVALALRNLFVLMLRHDESAKAQQFLALGMNAYSGYAELFYLAALLAVRERRFAQALPFLEKAKSREGGFLGSGGESSYRADWLLGFLAARVGNHRVAFNHFLTGLNSTPVFLPAVEELLNLRLPPRIVEAHQYDFCRAVRREPQLLDKVFPYLLLHRAFDAAQRIARTIPIDEQRRAELDEQLASASAPFQANGVSQSTKMGILVCGPFFEHTSLARINREIAAGLLPSQERAGVQAPRLDICLEPSSPSALPPQIFVGGDSLTPALLRHPQQLDLTIRHQWPPDFRRPSRGNLAVIVPWEYGAVPRAWVEQIEHNVDELWVPSRFVRDVFVRAGVTAHRVVVVPNGVDTKVFTNEGRALRPQGARKFAFLFVGGAIRRKGVDLLLEAYKAAFDPGEDVSLILAMSGAAGAYQHNSLLPQIQRAAHDHSFPHVQPLLDSFDDATLASLYRGCDAFVLPYRGEGFGMPLLEAMACGKPVITTAPGPSTDFCSDKTAYLVSAREEEVPDEPPPLGPLTGPFTWFEPDFAELARTLRHVYQNRDEAAQRGAAAAKRIREQFSWVAVTSLYAERIRTICRASRIGQR